MAGPRRLTRAQAVAARRRYHRGGISQAELARELGISHSAVDYLIRGQTYRDAGGPVGSLGEPQRSRVDLREARRLRASGWTLRALGERYGVSHVRVRQVLHRG